MAGRRFGLTLLMMLPVLVSILGCNPGAAQSVARMTGRAAPAVSRQVDILAGRVGTPAANAAVLRVGRNIDSGVKVALGTAEEVPPELRSAFTDVVCHAVSKRVEEQRWPTDMEMVKFAADALDPNTAKGAAKFIEAAFNTAKSIMQGAPTDRQAATDVVCAVGGFASSR